MPVGPDQPMSADAVNDLPWERVESSNLHAIAQEGEFLYVRFSDGGRVYRYRLPAADGFDLLREANAKPEGSVGKVFNQLVRGRKEIEAAQVQITE